VCKHSENRGCSIANIFHFFSCFQRYSLPTNCSTLLLQSTVFVLISCVLEIFSIRKFVCVFLFVVKIGASF
jgi:hypothetical protein